MKRDDAVPTISTEKGNGVGAERSTASGTIYWQCEPQGVEAEPENSVS